MIDPVDFADDLAELDKFCERRSRGIPPDRWTTTEGLHKVARAAQTLYAIAYASAEAAVKAEYRRGLEAMKMEGES